MSTQPSGTPLTTRYAAWLFLLPFLLVYGLFLVYPFLKGVWISLHEWNLLAVAFNPDAKTFIGLENYKKLFWGRDIIWSASHQPFWQWGGALLAMLALALAYLLPYFKAYRLWLWVIVLAGITLFISPGFHPSADGRWYDRRFWPIVGNTITFVLLTAPLITALALVLAAALNRQSRSMSVFRTLFFLSQVLSVTVVTLIWQLMFSPRQGLIANITMVFGGSPVSWLTDERFAMLAIVITTVWWSLGIALLLVLAGLQNINPEIYEAAQLDGAGARQTFFHITLPNLGRTISLVVVLQIILHFQVFGQAHLMTNGGPNDSTQVLVRYIYQTAFRDSDLGRASAMAVFLFMIMAAFSAIQFALSRSEK